MRDNPTSRYNRHLFLFLAVVRYTKIEIHKTSNTMVTKLSTVLSIQLAHKDEYQLIKSK